jgi:hypothetical protein
MSIQAPVTTETGSGLFDDVVSPGCLLLGSESVDLDSSRRMALADVGLAAVTLGEAPSHWARPRRTASSWSTPVPTGPG